MSPFEYVIVLISIILGLGITTILTGVAEWIKHYRNSTLYGPYIIWIVIVFIMHIHEWWQCYTLKSITAWQLPLFLFVVLYPIVLYVLAHLLFPRQQDSPFDARAFYLDHYPGFFICALIGAVLSVIHNLTIEQLEIKDQIVQLLLIAVLASTLISKTRNHFVHAAIAFGLLLILIVALVWSRDMLLVA
jgi:hypothetical protein